AVDRDLVELFFFGAAAVKRDPAVVGRPRWVAVAVAARQLPDPSAADVDDPEIVEVGVLRTIELRNDERDVLPVVRDLRRRDERDLEQIFRCDRASTGGDRRGSTGAESRRDEDADEIPRS